jgi:TolB-like protein
MGLIAELKRRNVLRMAGLYLVAAWLIIQVANNILPVFGTPPWVLKTLIITLAIGLLPVIALSWAFEFTPDGFKRDAEVDPTQPEAQHTARRLNRLLIGTLLLALAYFAVDKFVIGRAPEPAGVAISAAVKTTEAPSIAVLPFDNRSAIAEDAFFVDGMHDDILTQLSKISGLKVISRTSVESFRDSKLPVREIARRLGVKTILEGGVQRGGNRVRINMQLIDAATDNHLWAETYDRELNAENIFAIQSEVTAAITGSLQTTLTTGEKAGLAEIPTKSLAAWEAFQLGKQRRSKRTSTSLLEAEGFFNKAIALDPGFVLAQVLLADTYISQIWYSGKDRTAQLDKASAIIATVRKAHPNMPEALSTAGSIAVYRGEGVQGERLLRQALSLQPNYVSAMHVLADYLPGIGKPDEAVLMINRAIALDPLSPVLYGKRAAILEDMGRFEAAKASYLKALEIDPDSASATFGLAVLDAYIFGRLDTGITQIQKAIALDSGNPMFLNLLAVSYQDIGLGDNSLETAKQVYRKYGGEFVCTLAYAELLAGNGTESERLSSKAPGFSCGQYWMLQNGRQRDYIQSVLKDNPTLFDVKTTLMPYQVLSAYPMVYSLKAEGRGAEATQLAERMLATLKPAIRMGLYGYGLTDAALLAQLGRREQALQALEQAVAAGWQGGYWQFMRDHDQSLEPIRRDPRFIAAFARIQASVDAQRARLPAIP